MHHPYFKVSKQPKATRGNFPWGFLGNLCQSYGWPEGLPGGGVIGIVELGGGWQPDDVSQFFAMNKLVMPAITDVSVDSGAGNSPGGEADVEVALDIQIAAGAYAKATGKAAAVRMYWALNDLNGISRAVAKAAADGCDVCSISWGSDEADWGEAAADTMEGAAAAATAAGMVVFAASGDNDSSDGGTTPANVDLPASCPHVIGCGGTMRPHGPTGANPERVWNNNPGNADGEGTGGGFSTLFEMPPWQLNAPHGMRMVPDLAANADPGTGYAIVSGGQQMVVGGTSAVAPLYAGLFAAFGTKLGFVTPKLWMNQLSFNDITAGDNGAYRAALGPDPCTGLGSLRGRRVAALFVPVA